MSGRILIVDDVATNRIVYRARLAAAFYEPILASDGASCLEAAQSGLGPRPDLILLDLNLPDMPGHEVLRQLRADPRSRDIPVIVLTAAQDATARLAAFTAGADDVILKPAADRVLLARVRNLMRSQAEFAGDAALPGAGFAEAPVSFEPPGTLAVVTALPEVAADLQTALTGLLRDRLVALTRTQALAEALVENATQDRPNPGRSLADVFIVAEDDSGPGASLRLLSELKSHQATRHAAVCLLLRGSTHESAAMALDLGADDVVDQSIPPAELAVRLRSLVRRKRLGDQQRARMQDSLRLAMVDPLTGLYNRRYAGPHLSAIAARAGETGSPYAVMVVDLDRFKRVNDQHGHAAGDLVLVEVARRLTANLRDSDLLARIGGEEFLIVLPDSGMAEARRVAERLCQAVEERPIRLPSGAGLTVTVSIGVAVSDGAATVDAVVEQADLALLDSKVSGRNQVTFRLSAA
jgi:two-component system cell cycle response regulator